MTKKYRVIKKWPLGPNVGAEFETDSDTIFPIMDENGWQMLNRRIKVSELAEYLEEVKEPEEFWFMDEMGDICSGRDDLPGSHDDWKSSIPDWLRFKTKEACEKFRDGLIATHGERSVIGAGTTPYVHCLVNALNQRVAK